LRRYRARKQAVTSSITYARGSGADNR